MKQDDGLFITSFYEILKNELKQDKLKRLSQTLTVINTR